VRNGCSTIASDIKGQGFKGQGLAHNLHRSGRSSHAGEGLLVNAEIAIDIRNLSLTFETGDSAVHALDNANLSVAKGEFVSFIGPSGCGKTTLLRVIADLETPSLGSITVNGMSAREARLNRHYGYVFQAPALYPWRTVEANVTERVNDCETVLFGI
jgi:NitT/TauT family transport system ATP-binding protein